MNILFWGLTVGMAGKVLLAVGVIMAHSQISHEHKIDLKVLKAFKLEHTFALIGITLIIIGYFMEIYFYGFTPFLTCAGNECMAAVNAVFSQ